MSLVTKDALQTLLAGSTQIVPVSGKPVTTYAARRYRRLLPLLGGILLVLVLGACAPEDAPPAALCDSYNRALFTTQLVGGAAVLLGLAVLGFRKNLAGIFPSQAIQLGAVAGSVGLGLILLAFSTDIGGQILTGFSLPNLYSLCGF